MSSQAPSRQKSENYTAVKTTSAFEVQLREKPKESQPLARPSSYAYTPSTKPDKFIKPDIAKPPARGVEVTARSQPSSNRDNFTSRQLDRTQNPSGAENANRDRRVKSTFEPNFEKSLRSDFRAAQKPIVGESSSRFKQTLSMFQSKETEGGNVGPVKALPPSLATQRSVGRISRLPGQDVKPSYSVVEMRRGSVAERKYQPSTETSNSYKTDAARLRGVSRSVQGLDTLRSDYGIQDASNKAPQSDFLSKYRNEKYGSRNFGKVEVSGANSVETSSSRAHSSDEEREKVQRNLSGKDSADSDKALEARESRGSSQFGHEAEPKKRYDANGTSGSAGVGVKSSYSTPANVADWDKKPGSNIRRDDNQRTTVTSSEEIRIRTNKTDDDTRVGQGSESLKLNEPKDLYAYKHRTPLVEESVIGSRDTGKQTTKYDEYMRRCDSKSPETKSSHYESLKTDPAVRRYDITESYGRDDYKKTDAAPYRVPYKEPEKSASDLSYQPQKVTQQTSISDIFSKRSSAAVIRGKSSGAETEPPFVPSVAPKVVETIQTGSTARSPAERYMARRLEAAVDDTIKEFHYDADRTTKTKDPSAIAGDVTEAKIKHDQDEPSRRTDYDVTSVTRTSRDPYGSNRRHHGLERTSVAEPVSDRITTDHQQPAFEVNFSVSEAEKPSRFGENKTDKGNIETVAVEKEKQEQKSGQQQQSAFELNFSVSELEKQRRFGENKMEKSNVVESPVVEKERRNENAELIRINDSLVVKTPKEEKRLTEDHKIMLVVQDKGITQDQKTSSEDQKIPFGDQKTPYGDHKTAADDKKTSYQPQDSFHRPQIKTGSIGRHDVDAETKSEKTTNIGDWESSKSHRHEFEIEIDTRRLLPDRNSSEKRMPAVSLSTEPSKTLHCGLQQELIVEFPESKFKESTRKEVKDTTDDFYFGMTGGTSEEIRQHKKTGKTAELVVEIPKPEERQPSRVDLLPFKEHRLSPEEHKLPSHDHKLRSHEHKLPSEEHQSLSQEPKTEPKTPSKEHKLSSLEHSLSPLPSPENKSQPEEHKISPHDHKLPPYEQHKFPTEVHKLSPLEPKTSAKEHTWPSEERTLPSYDHKLPSHERKLPREEQKLPPTEPKTPPSERKLPSEEDKLPSLEHRLSPLPSPEHKSRSEEHKIPSEQHKLPSQERRLWQEEEKPSLLNRNTNSEIGLVINLDSHPDVKPTAEKLTDKVVIAELDTLLDGTRFDMNSNIPTDTKKTPSPPPRSTMILQDEDHDTSTFDPLHDKGKAKTTVGIVL